MFTFAGAGSRSVEEMVEELLVELGLDEQEVAMRKAYHGLSDQDLALIRDLHDRLSTSDPQFIERFYDHLRGFPQTRALLPEEKALPTLQAAQSRYFRDLLRGDTGPAYVRERLRVGVVHQRVGIEPRWFLGAYSGYLTGLLEQIWQLGMPVERTLATFRALLKLVFFDMGLALDTYIQADKQALAENKAFAEQVINCMPTGLLVLDTDLTVRAVNTAARGILLTDGNNLIGQPLASVLPVEQFREHIEAVLTTGQHHHNIPIQVTGPCGERHLELSLSTTRFGDTTALLLMIEDVSEEIQLRQELKDAAEREAALVQNVPDAIITIDEYGRIESFNSAAERIFGYRAEEIIGQNVKRLMPDPYRSEHDGYLARFRATGEAVCLGKGKREVEGMRKDGSVFPLDLATSEMHLHDRRLFIGVLRDITERKQAEAELTARKAELRAMFDNAVDGIITIDEQGLICMFSPAAERIFGYTAEEVQGKNISMLMPEPDRSRHDVYLQHYLATGQGKILGIGPREVTGLRKNGETFAMNLATSEMWLGDTCYFLGLVRDISQHKAEQAQMQQLSSALEQIADVVLITNVKGIIEYVNPAFTEITGYTPEEVLGKTPKMLQSGKHDREFYKNLWACLKRGEVFHDVFVNRRKDGTEYYEEKTITPLRNAAGEVTHFVATGKDISERMQTHARLQYLAHHDVLTGLPNRALFREHLNQAINSAERLGSEVGVLFIDLDNFKHLNDSLGHDVGDEALKLLSRRLQQCLRVDDSIARLGGDEFVVLLNGLQQNDDAGVVAAKLLELLSQPFHLAGQDLYLNASIGISLYPSDGTDVNTLLKHADLAMYRAKEQGRGGYAYYQTEMTEASHDRLLLERDLREALQQEQWELHYQPQVDMNSGKVVGVEALLRWRHPVKGLIPPARFIPLLEETRMILEVSRWVLQQACHQFQAWRQQGITLPCIAVNISAWQFRDPNLFDDIRGILAGCDLEASQLELEITESALMVNGDNPVATLEALKQMGLRIAIDDFGTGYSSLGYLKQFPLDALKVDRSFVKDLPNNRDDCAITQAIIGLASTLGLEVIAEGVETEAQRGFLRSLGCRIYQGYLFSKPLPANQLTPLLLAHPSPAQRD